MTNAETSLSDGSEEESDGFDHIEEIRSKRMGPDEGHGSADPAFLEGYRSAYWHSIMSRNIRRRLDFVNDLVGLWLSEWGGVKYWHGGLPQDLLREQREAGYAILFHLECAFDGDVNVIEQDDMRDMFSATIKVTRMLAEGLGVLESLLRE